MLRDPRVERASAHLAEEGRERSGRHAPAPEGSPDPVANLEPAVVLEHEDVARHLPVELDRPRDHRAVPKDRPPVRHERFAIAWRERGHPAGLRVRLVVEEDREVFFDDVA